MYEQRIENLRDILSKKNIDALLISNFYNILYLTGFKTLTTDEREAFVLVTQNNTYLFSDERYLSKNYELRTMNYEQRLIEPNKGLLFHLKKIIAEEKVKTLGFEAEDIKYYEHSHIVQQLPYVKSVATDRLVLHLREIKDNEEINKLTEVCEITDRCLYDITRIIEAGMAEKELAFKMELWIREKGYDLAFDPIVAVDENSSAAHYNTKDGDGTVTDKSIILIDFGVKYKNYLSDITRMIFVGKPNNDISRAYNTLLDAQKKTVDKLSDITNLKDADEYCRKIITDNQLPSYPHSTGHGVGLEIHEYPKVSSTSQDQKTANQVLTIEPGVYFPGKWGMRIEDTVVIDKDLSARTLTKYSKEIQII